VQFDQGGDPRLHGEITIFANGGFVFVPAENDPYWRIEKHSVEPIPVYVQYRVFDGFDCAVSRFGIGHGYYRRGGHQDAKQEGSAMYFLGGGGNGEPFKAGRKRFFCGGSRGKDILVLAQSEENKEFADRIYDYFADGGARSLNSLNITTREQAEDPRVAAIVQGADLIWIGGGSQCSFLEIWSCFKAQIDFHFLPRRQM